MTSGEKCDDGTQDLNGCNLDCSGPLPGWTCHYDTFYERSFCQSKCNDGIKTSDEECDDGNSLNSDGCSKNCLIEDGWECTYDTSKCTPICGDGKLIGNE